MIYWLRVNMTGFDIQRYLNFFFLNNETGRIYTHNWCSKPNNVIFFFFLTNFVFIFYIFSGINRQNNYHTFTCFDHFYRPGPSIRPVTLFIVFTVVVTVIWLGFFFVFFRTIRDNYLIPLWLRARTKTKIICICSKKHKRKHKRRQTHS